MEYITLEKVFTHENKTYIAKIDGYCDQDTFDSELRCAINNHDDHVESLDEYQEQQCEDGTYNYTFIIEPCY